ncbi:MAG: hypothetical protein R2706_18505 [Acidimicrobiales bacterium]
MTTDATPRIDIGTFGVWSGTLDLQPTTAVKEAVAVLDQQGWGCLWRPESTGREPFVSAAIYLGACNRMAVATGIAQTYAVTRSPQWRPLGRSTKRFRAGSSSGLRVSHAPLVEGIRKLDYSTPCPTCACISTRWTPHRSLRSAATVGPLACSLHSVPKSRASRQSGPMARIPTSRHQITPPLLATSWGPTSFSAPEHMVCVETDPAKREPSAGPTCRSLLAAPQLHQQPQAPRLHR